MMIRLLSLHNFPNFPMPHCPTAEGKYYTFNLFLYQYWDANSFLLEQTPFQKELAVT